MVKFIAFAVIYVGLLAILSDHPYRIDPQQILTQMDTEQSAVNVLGDSSLPKTIKVDLNNQHLYAYEGNTVVYDFVISSGKWDRTPNGTFKIWAKVRSNKMEGGSKALGTYYYLPNVPYIMFFYNDSVKKQLGYSFHGTYWHNNFGIPMSHGCINMKTAEAKLLYNWANLDTTVTIFGKYNSRLAGK